MKRILGVLLGVACVAGSSLVVPDGNCDQLTGVGNFLGAGLPHDVEVCACNSCKERRKNMPWLRDDQWKLCTNMISQYRISSATLEREKAELSKTIKAKKDLGVAATNETARFSVVTNSLATAAERQKRFEANKFLIEQNYQKAQRGK